MAIPGSRFLSRSRVSLLMLLAITLAVRVGVLVAMQDNLQKDPDAYHNIAINLLRFGVYGMGTSLDQPPQPTAYRPPLYPLVLAKFASDGTQVVLWRVALVHVVLGLATVWLTWVVAGQMEGSEFRVQGSGDTERGRVGERGRDGGIAFRFVAGLIVACDPLLLNQSTLVMTETLAAFLTVLCLFALNRFTADRRPWNAGLAGCTIGLAILCRPTYLPWLGLVGLTMLLLRHANPTRQRRTGTMFGEGLPTPPQEPTAGLRCPPESETTGTDAGEVRRPAPNPRQRGTEDAQPSLMLRVSDWLHRVANVASLGLIAAVVVSPWAIRNQRVFGKPIVSTTHGGYTLLLGNNDEFYDYLSSRDATEQWDSAGLRNEIAANHFQWLETRVANWNPKKRNDLGQINPHAPAFETVYDGTLYWKTIEVIKGRPYDFLYACLYRLRQFWSPLPHRLTADESLARTIMRYVVAAWYVGVYLLAAAGIWKLRGKLLTPPWLWGLLLCLVYTGIHTFYWTNLRMRAPIMPIVALVAAYGFTYLWQWSKARRLGPPNLTAGAAAR